MIYKKIIPALFLITSCAQIVSPGGGPKDETAPIVKSTYPKTKTINFNDNKIEITFDEYVEIKNPEQIVISPYIKEKPTIESEGKTIVVDLKKSILEKDKTYTINFGNSISDIHEGIILENYSYCFSTGSYIDSLSIEGKLVNAIDLKPEKGITVGLYPIENFEDSTPMKTYPSYLSQTNETGEYQINNLPPSKYFLFAFKDDNKNLKYEKIENVAFETKPIESAYPKTKINIFLSEPRIHTKNKILDTLNREPGVYTLAFYEPKAVEITKNNQSKINSYRWQHNENQIDTLIIYTKDKPDTSSSIFNLSIDKIDAKIEIKNRKKLKNKALEFKSNRDISLNDTLYLTSNYPIDSLPAKKLTIKADTLEQEYKIKQIDNFNWAILFKKEEAKTYELNIKDSSIYDIWNRPNKEFKSSIQTKNSKETGTLSLNIINTAGENYIIQLVSGDEKETIIKEVTNNKSEIKLFDYLAPVELRVKVIKDSNKNGKWDRADWLERTQAEEVGYLEQKLTIRAFWDIEQSIDLQKITSK